MDKGLLIIIQFDGYASYTGATAGELKAKAKDIENYCDEIKSSIDSSLADNEYSFEMDKDKGEFRVTLKKKLGPQRAHELRNDLKTYKIIETNANGC